MAAISSEDLYPVKAFGLAARDSSGVLSPFNFSVRHEIVGLVTEIGNKVHKCKVGDKVGVGFLAGSCRKCDMCANDLENYCSNWKAVDGFSLTDDGTRAYGGCSHTMVVDEHFVILWPENFPLDSGVPLLCAGIITYSPLRRYGLDKPGMHIGIVGLGGIGHVAVKIAKAFGAKVTVISTSITKKQEAEKYGSDSFLISNDPEQMKAAASTLDGIIDTVPVTHNVVPLLDMLKPLGKLIIVGAPEKPIELPVPSLLNGGKVVAGSNIGGLNETQEMINFAAKHNILADVEVIPIEYVNTAIERINKGEVKYRFVIDIGKTLKSA